MPKPGKPTGPRFYARRDGNATIDEHLANDHFDFRNEAGHAGRAVWNIPSQGTVNHLTWGTLKTITDNHHGSITNYVNERTSLIGSLQTIGMPFTELMSLPTTTIRIPFPDLSEHTKPALGKHVIQLRTDIQKWEEVFCDARAVIDNHFQNSNQYLTPSMPNPPMAPGSNAGLGQLNPDSEYHFDSQESEGSDSDLESRMDPALYIQPVPSQTSQGSAMPEAEMAPTENVPVSGPVMDQPMNGEADQGTNPGMTSAETDFSCYTSDAEGDYEDEEYLGHLANTYGL